MAISQGDQLIKEEVLEKLQQANTQLENERENDANCATEMEEDTKAQRKRKMSMDKAERKARNKMVHTGRRHVKADKTKQYTNGKADLKNKQFSKKSDYKPHIYKNVNYKKFLNESDSQNSNLHKLKFKKHK